MPGEKHQAKKKGGFGVMTHANMKISVLTGGGGGGSKFPLNLINTIIVYKDF